MLLCYVAILKPWKNMLHSGTVLNRPDRLKVVSIWSLAKIPDRPDRPDRNAVAVIVDDILVWGKDDQEHDQRVLGMLEKARQAILKLRKEKRDIRASTPSYIGHQLTSDGLKPDPKKIRAIKEIPVPCDKKSLQRILGMVQYVAKFIPDISTIAPPPPPRHLTRNDSDT